MARNYVAIPHSYLEEMDALTDEEFGRLIRGVLHYSLTGEAISPVGNEKFYVKRVIMVEDGFQAAFEETDNKKTERARKAAAARWQKDMLEDAQASVSIISNAKDAINKNNIIKNNIPKEEKINKKEERKRIAKKTVDAEFNKFWEVYPRKVGKGTARKSFEKVMQSGISVETLISAVEQQRQSKQWTDKDGQFIPYPATWLNGERWEDSVQVEKSDERVPVDAGELDWLLEDLRQNDIDTAKSPEICAVSNF